jgi:hypothetical protein
MTVVVLFLAVGLPASVAGAEPRAGKLMQAAGLSYFPVKCESERGCRIDCYQGGRVVVSRINLGKSDVILLAMNARFSDSLQPLWIEIREQDGSNQTVLLNDEAICDFQEMTISPIPLR